MDPFVFCTLPPPIVLSPGPLVVLYSGVLVIDYALLRPPRSTAVIWLVALAHCVLPLSVVSSSQPLNIFFTAAPIYLASFTGHCDRQTLASPWRWVYALATDLVDPEQGGHVRLHGLAKMCRGVFKLSLLYTVLEPTWGALGMSPSVETLALPWYHPWTLVYNLLLGITAYCLLGTVDVFLGLEQAVAGVRFMDLFEAPILASSPRDFWSRRWNRVVRRQFHGQVFMPKENMDKKDLPSRGGFWGSRNGRGLIVFMLSGVLHELILWSNSREVTLENFAFFTLHGVAVMVEANVTRHRPRPSHTVGLWACRMTFLLFMTLTARLFVAPFLRHDFWTPLPLGFQKVPIPA